LPHTTLNLQALGRFKMENMQSFKTNDNVTLKYFDSGAAEEGDDEKPWLILVSTRL
jgi:hypothetical protein